MEKARDEVRSAVLALLCATRRYGERLSLRLLLRERTWNMSELIWEIAIILPFAKSVL